MNSKPKEKLSISLNPEYVEILDTYCEIDNRTRSNMIEYMIKFFHDTNKMVPGKKELIRKRF